MKPLVLVMWIDAQDHHEKWVDAADAEKFGEESCMIASVGFLIRKTEKYVTLGADWDEVDTNYGRVTKIPTAWIQSIEDLMTKPIEQKPDPNLQD